MFKIGVSKINHTHPESHAVFNLLLNSMFIAPDKDWRQLGIYPPLFDLIGYFKF